MTPRLTLVRGGRATSRDFTAAMLAVCCPTCHAQPGQPGQPCVMASPIWGFPRDRDTGDRLMYRRHHLTRADLVYRAKEGHRHG